MAQTRTPHILDQILDAKRREVERLKAAAPQSALEQQARESALPLNMAGALMGDQTRVIAEVKRRSPSKGLLCENFDPVAIARAYASGGAAAISVLTEADHFDGSIGHLEAVSAEMRPKGLPTLRKDFIFDPYQVYEARAHGADSLLLIVAALSTQQLGELIELAQRLWLQCLVEVHDEAELRTAIDAGAELLGINNRDLRTFDTDLATTERLAPLVPDGKIIVSESGIATRNDVLRVQRAGAHAILVGEALVTSDDPGARLGELL